LELLRKELGVLPVQDHDTWQQQRASADDEVKISSWCGYCPITILTDPHYKSKSKTKSVLKEIRSVHPDLGLQKPLVCWSTSSWLEIS